MSYIIIFLIPTDLSKSGGSHAFNPALSIAMATQEPPNKEWFDF